LVEAVKTSTSKWIKTKGEEFRQFGWQTGYGVFSVSRSNLDAVDRYILNQKEHHKKKDFKDEFRGMLTKHDLD
jgi:putative transposase